MDNLTDWSINFDNLGHQELGGILKEQWIDANHRFIQFIENNYSSWINGKDRPMMSFE